MPNDQIIQPDTFLYALSPFSSFSPPMTFCAVVLLRFQTLKGSNQKLDLVAEQKVMVSLPESLSFVPAQYDQRPTW
jgi:hypothetical protein